MNKVFGYKFVLWGIENNIEILQEKIQKIMPYGEIIGITDVNIRQLIPLKEKYDIVTIDCVQDIEFDFIIVMPQRPTTINNIIHHSSYIGIPKEKIVHYSIFEFGFDKYIDLKKSNISIVSQFCWGGANESSIKFEI